MNDQMDNDELMVSIRCLTYNHEPYIRQCLEGFIMQKTNFRFEAVVHDDASTDGTAAIIHEYAEKYPNIIKPIYENENQYSRHDGSLDRIMNAACTGKYIALCEGDDYWTDPLKLQKQVDFLEMHSNYSLVCGGYLYGNSRKKILLEKEPISFDLNTYTKWYTKTLTVVFRKKFLEDYMDNIGLYRYSRDIHLFYYLLKKGRGYYSTDILGVYNVHEGGICSMVLPQCNAINSYNCYKELYENNKNDEYCRRMYFKSILSILYNKTSLFPNLKILKEGLIVLRGMKEFMYLLLYNFPIRYFR